MKKVYINISDIASYIGQNKWDYVTPFERLWQKCDDIGYNKLLYGFTETKITETIYIDEINKELNSLDNLLSDTVDPVDKENIQKELEKKKEEKVVLEEKIKNTDRIIYNNTKGEDKIRKHVKSDTIIQLEISDIKIDEKKTILRNEIKKMNIKEDVKKELLTEGESFINKSHGTKKESSAIELFEEKFGIKLDTSQKYYSDIIMKTEDFTWFIGGKMDGLYSNESDKFIVEVKNRVNGFFNRLRDYERTQIQLYMKIAKIPYAKLVERYNNKIRVTDIYEDILYINDTIEYLKVFINLFEKFLKDVTLQNTFILLDNEGKRRWIYSNFFKKFEELELIEQDCKI